MYGEPFSTIHRDLITETSINREVKVRGSHAHFFLVGDCEYDAGVIDEGSGVYQECLGPRR